jgi:hypothetical protein
VAKEDAQALGPLGVEVALDADTQGGLLAVGGEDVQAMMESRAVCVQ